MNAIHEIYHKLDQRMLKWLEGIIPSMRMGDVPCLRTSRDGYSRQGTKVEEMFREGDIQGRVDAEETELRGGISAFGDAIDAVRTSRTIIHLIRPFHRSPDKVPVHSSGQPLGPLATTQTGHLGQWTELIKGKFSG